MYMREQEFCRCFACDGILYQVRQGDTLFSVSRRFQVALEDVMDANPFINVYRLEPGMQICVPVRETEDGFRTGGEKTSENGRNTDGVRSFNGRGYDGVRSFDGRENDGGKSFEAGRDAWDCPYGLCRDPMRFDGMDW